MSDKQHDTRESIDIPVAPRDVPAPDLDNVKIEVDEIPQPAGHFALNYRRC
jgi:hypothetical protein